MGSQILRCCTWSTRLTSSESEKGKVRKERGDDGRAEVEKGWRKEGDDTKKSKDMCPGNPGCLPPVRESRTPDCLYAVSHETATNEFLYSFFLRISKQSPVMDGRDCFLTHTCVYKVISAKKKNNAYLL
jgi:hypothetical protein